MRPQEANILSPVFLFRELQVFCCLYTHVSDNYVYVFVYKTCCRDRGWATYFERKRAQVPYPRTGFLCWPEHGTERSCAAVRNIVSVHVGKLESALIQWSCMEIDISKATVSAGVVHGWAWLLVFAASSAGPGMLELGHAIALPLVLTKHPEPRTLTRQKSVCLKMKRFVVFSWTQMAPHKTHFLSRLNSLVKASWMYCGPYLHSVSSCLLCITVPQLPSCKGKLYQHSPPFNLCLGMDHAIHAETLVQAQQGSLAYA